MNCAPGVPHTPQASQLTDGLLRSQDEEGLRDSVNVISRPAQISCRVLKQKEHFGPCALLTVLYPTDVGAAVSPLRRSPPSLPVPLLSTGRWMSFDLWCCQLTERHWAVRHVTPVPRWWADRGKEGSEGSRASAPRCVLCLCLIGLCDNGKGSHEDN